MLEQPRFPVAMARQIPRLQCLAEAADSWKANSGAALAAMISTTAHAHRKGRKGDKRYRL
jgi:hypothetical protein